MTSIVLSAMYSQLPPDLKIEWNARLRKTAGLCRHKRNKKVIGPNNECLRTSEITLSTKVFPFNFCTSSETVP